MFNKEIRSKIQVPNAEIDSFYEENKASFNVPETRFHVAQIVVTPAADVPVANLRNDKARGEEQARQKAERIAASLSAGEDFARLAQEFPRTPTPPATTATWGSSRLPRWKRLTRSSDRPYFPCSQGKSPVSSARAMRTTS